MIASLHGQVQLVRDDALVVQVGGVGYYVHVVQSVLETPPRVGQNIELYTHLHVRENELTLYGFSSIAELDLFAMLLEVSGIGPRTALAALSAFSPETLRSIIAQGNAAALTRIPGIGRKTAQRLMLDLRDRIGPTDAEPLAAETPREIDVDALNALTALGYSLVEAQNALGATADEASELDERILAALRYLGSH
ncbi:MAG TPA: Holliday junction branch migration protein RuvA [Chloroflexi bacterium]|nr:Holliday junction branch migration protein RuvA [Chloroflexota bacterium]